MWLLKRDSRFLSLMKMYPLTGNLKTSFQAIFSFLINCLAMTIAVKCTSLTSPPSANIIFISFPEGSGTVPVSRKASVNVLFNLKAKQLFWLFPFPLQHGSPEKAALTRNLMIVQLCVSSWRFNLTLISEGKYTSVFYLYLVSLYLNFAWISIDEYCMKIQIQCI